MSRTNLNITPRRSKRLLCNGYYQNTSDEESVVDFSDAEAERTKHYRESPVKIFNRYRKGGKPAKGTSSSAINTSRISTTHDSNTRSIRRAQNKSAIDYHKTVSVTNLNGINDQDNDEIRHVASTSQVIQRSRLRMGMRNGGAGEGGDNRKAMQKEQMLHPESVEKNVLDGMMYEKHQKTVTVTSETTSVENDNHYSAKARRYSDNDLSYSSITSASDSFRKDGQHSTVFEGLRRFVYYSILYRIFKFVTWMITIDTWLLSRRPSSKHSSKLFPILFLLCTAGILFYLYHTTSEVPLLLTDIKFVPSALVSFPSTVATFLSTFSRALPPANITREEIQRPSVSTVDFEQAYYRMELLIADQAVKMQKKFDELHAKITSETEARILLERKLNAESESVYLEKINEFETRVLQERDLLVQAKKEMQQNIDNLHVIFAAMQHNMTSHIVRTDTQFDGLQKLLSSSSDSSNKLTDFNSRLVALDSRIDNLHTTLMKVMSDFDKHIGNTTYISEIAKIQFVKSFLQMIQDNVEQTGQMSKEQKNLHYLFLAWLNKQGFVKVDTIHNYNNKLQINITNSAQLVEERLMAEIKKLQVILQKQSDELTLATLVPESNSKHMRSAQTSELTQELVKKIIAQELDLYSADRTGKTDFALESSGGTIVNTRCSESYTHLRGIISIFGIPIQYKVNSPRTIIQPSVMPGNCWAFKGTSGFIVIELSHEIIPTSFTLEHAPRQLMPDNTITSAPKDFSVYALTSSYDQEGLLLGVYRYEEFGTPLQEYKVADGSIAALTKFIELRVNSNWGNDIYTCIYRFRVHGRLQQP